MALYDNLIRKGIEYILDPSKVGRNISEWTQKHQDWNRLAGQYGLGGKSEGLKRSGVLPKAEDNVGVLEQLVHNKNSSCIDTVSYDAKHQTLTITFVKSDSNVSGFQGIYKYYGVPLTVLREMAMSASAGRFFNQSIKDKYSFHTVRKASTVAQSQAIEEQAKQRIADRKAQVAQRRAERKLNK